MDKVKKLIAQADDWITANTGTALGIAALAGFIAGLAAA